MIQFIEITSLTVLMQATSAEHREYERTEFGTSDGLDAQPTSANKIRAAQGDFI